MDRNRNSFLGQGMSQTARIADVEQSDRDYILQRQRRFRCHGNYNHYCDNCRNQANLLNQR